MSYDGTLKFNTSLDASGVQKGANKLGDIVKGLGIFKILSAGLDMIANSVDAAFGRIDTMEQFNRVMTTMTGSAGVTNRALQTTNEIVTGTAYGLDVAAGSVQKFVSRGMDVDKATASVERWGDAVAFYGDGSNVAFSSVTEALGKMQTKGNVTMEHLEALLNAGIPAIEIYASAMQMGTEDVTTAMSKGELKADDFINVMNQAFNTGVEGFPSVAGAAKKAGASWSGTFDNMKAAIARGTQSIITSIDETSKSVGGPTMREAIGSFGKWFEKSLNSVAKGIQPVIKNLDKLLVVVGIGAAGFAAYKIATLAVIPAITATKIAMGEAAAAVSLVHSGYSAAAVASTGLTVGQSVLAAVTGVLTGKMGAASAVQLIWNAAMNANPILTIITLVATLAGGVALLAMSMDDGVESTKELTVAARDAQDAMEDIDTNFQESKQSAEASAFAAGQYVDRLEELEAQGLKTVAQQREYEMIVEQLNELMPDLNITIDEQTGLIEGGTNALRENIQSWKDYYVQQAFIEKNTKILEKYGNVQYELIDNEIKLKNSRKATNDLNAQHERIQKEITRVTEEHNAAVEKQLDLYGENTLGTIDQDKAYLDLIAELQEVNNQIYTEEMQQKELNDALKTGNNTLVDLDAQVDEFGVTMETYNARVDAAAAVTDGLSAATSAADSTIQSASETTQAAADAEEEALKQREEALESYTKAATDMFSKIETESELSIAEMTENLQHNQDAVANWASNLETLARRGLDEGLLKELREAGPESAGAVRAIVEGTDEELVALNDAFRGGTDTAVNTLLTTLGLPEVQNAGTGLVDDIASGVTNNEALTDATMDMVQKAKSTLSEGIANTDFESMGQQIANKIVNGVSKSDMSGITKSISSAVKSGTTGVKSAVESLSFAVLGVLESMSGKSENVVIKMMSGIKTTIVTRTAGVQSSISSMSNAMVTAYDSVVEKMSATTKRMTAAVKTAISTNTDSVESSAITLKNKIISGLSSMATEGPNVAVRMMDGIYTAMVNGAGRLYTKADQIAGNIAATMRKALDVHSPSRVMIELFKYVMLGILKGMVNEENKLYKEADAVSAGIAERLNIDPDSISSTLSKLKAIVSAGPVSVTATIPAVQQAYAGGGNTTYSPTYVQYITTPKPITASEATREADDLMRRTKWQLP